MTSFTNLCGCDVLKRPVSALIGPYVNPVVSQAVACRVFKDLMPDLFPGMCHEQTSLASFPFFLSI